MRNNHPNPATHQVTRSPAWLIMYCSDPPLPPPHTPEGIVLANCALQMPPPSSPLPSYQKALLRLILHCSAQVHEGGGTSWLAYRGDMTVACGESKPSQTRERAASGTK